MTREEAILHMTLRREELKHSVGDLDEDIKAFDMAIQALEQEPRYIVKCNASAEGLEKLIKSIDNPIVIPSPVTITPIYADVLDKIRAEIEKIPTAFATAYTAKSEALKIIDKYREGDKK